ncbi:MAG: hemolysin family protein [Candidatus Brocadiales bacterium]
MEDGSSYLILHIPELLLYLLLLFLSAFFSASESALFSLTREEVQDLTNKSWRSPINKIIAQLLDDPRSLLVTILCGNLLANIGCFSLSYGLIEDIVVTSAFGGVLAIGGASIGAVFIMILLGEAIPKSIAVKTPLRIAQLVALPIYFLKKVLLPVRIPLKFIVDGLNFIFGKKHVKETQVTLDELKMLVEFSEKQGMVDKHERKMIHAVLDFGNIQVKDVMVPRVDVTFCDMADAAKGFLSMSRQTRHKKIPVYEDTVDNIVGVIHAKDVFLNPDGNLRSFVRTIQFVPESQAIESLLRQFRRQHTQMAIVVDEYGGTAGLVTLEDILEEIVGEILDEFDRHEEPIKQLDGNKYHVAGNLNIHDWSKHFGIELESHECDTVGGFVVTLLDRIPQNGDRVEYKDIIFTVENVRKRRITMLLQEHIETKVDNEVLPR